MELEKTARADRYRPGRLICQQRKPELTGVWLPILNGLIPQVNVKCLRFTAEAYETDAKDKNATRIPIPRVAPSQCSRIDRRQPDDASNVIGKRRLTSDVGRFATAASR
jgi:hypothetical protein